MKTVRIGNVDIRYDIWGEIHDTDMILISGLGSQMIRWEDSFCQSLVDEGFRLIRFDNRDSGGSVWNHPNEITSDQNIEEIFSTLQKEDIPYSLMDMANDVIGLLDALKISRVHIVGRSMGGIIAQLLGSHFPERVISLTIIMSTSLNPTLPPPNPEVMAMMMKPPTDPNVNKDAYIKEKLAFAERISGSLYPLDYVQEIALIEEELTRSKTKNGIIRQLMAIGSHQYEVKMFKKIMVPTLIIHGTDDPIFHPESARDLKVSIPHSKLMLIDGMGHALPTQVHQLICKSITELVP